MHPVGSGEVVERQQHIPILGELRNRFGILVAVDSVAILGGSVETGPRPDGGFRVWARLPLEGDA